MTMNIQQLKDECNKNYAQAIEGMEGGTPAKDVALLLLNAAELLVKISKADFLRRAECEGKAAKLLAAAKSLRTEGDVAGVYKRLTGRDLPVREEPNKEQSEGASPVGEESAEQLYEQLLRIYAATNAENTESTAENAVSADAAPFKNNEENTASEQPQQTFSAAEPAAEHYAEGRPAKEQPAAKDGASARESNLDELKDLLKSGSGRGREYGKENTDGCRFAWDNIPKISFDDVAGLDDVKEAVMRKVLLPLKNPELYEGYVKKNGGGLLLYGPPGTGKTMIAAAIAHEIGAKFCSLGPSDLVLGGIGNTEKACVALFKEARSFPCAVLFFDEIESICPVNTHAQGARQLRSELLRQIQGMEAYGDKDDKILFLIAATNKPWDVDPAFVRPGRFGTRIYVGLPDAPARRYMLEKRIGKIMHTGKVMIGDINADYIVERTEGFNGADMTNLLDEVQELSALRSAKTGIKEILQQDFDNALKKVTSSVQQKDMQKLLEWKEQNG